MSKIDVSVVVPIYNVSKYIVECLDSLVKQENIMLQVICINDKTPDNSMEIVNEYIEKLSCLEIYENDKNVGLSETRNKGIDYAKGKYIMFLDSDDYFETNSLYELYNYAESNNLDVATFDTASFSDDDFTGEFPEDAYMRKFSYDISDGITLLNDFMNNKELIRTAWSSIYKTSYIKNNNIKFIPNIYHEDIPFTFEVMIKAEKVGCINKIIYNYRQRENSITKSGRYPQLVKGLIVGYEKMVSVLNASKLSAEEVKCAERYIASIKPMMFGYFLTSNAANIYMNKEIEDFIEKENIFNDEYPEKYIGEDVYRRIKSLKRVCVYGTGWLSKRIMWILNNENILVDKIYVTNNKDNLDKFYGIDVDEWKGQSINNEPVIVAVSKKFHNEIVETFKESKFTNFILVDFEG